MSHKVYLQINNKDCPLSRINSKVINTLNNPTYIHKSNKDFFINSTFFSKEVENVYRYSIVIKNNTFKLFCFTYKDSYHFACSSYNDRQLSIKKRLKSIILILESPHMDEFDNNFNSIAPAQGITGKYIEMYITHIIKDIYIKNPNKIEDGEYRIIIINPIPCQSSLHYLHKQSLSSSSSFKTLRDKVWYELWSQDPKYKNNFISTINSINPIIIINSCTAVIKSKYLNPLLKSKFNNYIVYSSNHPSSWYTKRINLRRL